MPKKDRNVDMKKVLRITGERDAPELPALSRDDFKPEIWKAVGLPSWTISEAAHYLHECIPSDNLDQKTANTVARTEFWLRKELDNEGQQMEIKKTPGDYLRLLWEAYKPFSPKIWTLYHLIDVGVINFKIEAHILAKRYERAADIVWKEFDNASVQEVAEFLITLPYCAKGSDGLPIFASRSIETVKDFIKPRSKLKAGHRVLDLRDAISEKAAYLTELIEKELG